MPTEFWTPEKPPSNKDRIWPRYSGRWHNRVLELGPFDGRDTVNLATRTTRLSVVESRATNLEIVERACNSRGINNVTSYWGNLEKFDVTALGRFDCIWCVGLLYHLPEPWKLVAQLAGITTLVYGWSHVAEYVSGERGGYKGHVYKEGGLKDPLSGMSLESWWIEPGDFERLWRTHFPQFEWLTNPRQPHPNGGWAAQFEARR